MIFNASARWPDTSESGSASGVKVPQLATSAETIARTMRDAAVCTKLRANTDPAKLYAILTENRGTQAA